MTIGRFATQLAHSVIGVLVLMSGWPSLPLANDDHPQKTASNHHEPADQKDKAGALVKVVRESTERFQHVSVAEAEGYALQFGCVSGSDAGAMGLHFVNGALVNEGVLDATRPQIVIYEPLPNGTLRLIGADYLLGMEGQPHRHVRELAHQCVV